MREKQSPVAQLTTRLSIAVSTLKHVIDKLRDMILLLLGLMIATFGLS